MSNANMIQVDGSPFERGQQIGALLKIKITNAIALWDKHFFETNKFPLNDYVDFIQEKKYFQTSINQYAPEYLDEVKGIADATKIPYPMLYAWQLADEHYWLIKLFNEDASVEEEGCSTFGIIKEDQQILMGQNLDIPAYKNGLQTIVKIKNDVQTQTVFSQVGLLGSFGCNSSGIALCVNTVSQLGHDENGLPVSYIVRKVLDSTNFKEAEEKLNAIPHASGQNYLLGGQGKIHNYECCSSQVSKIAINENKYLCHTNHPLAEGNLKFIKEKAFFGSTSKVRHEQLNEFLSQNNLSSDEKIAKGLFQKPVFISQEEPTNGIATFHTAYFILDQNAHAYSFEYKNSLTKNTKFTKLI